MRRIARSLVAVLALTLITAAPAVAGGDQQLVRDTMFEDWFYLDPVREPTYMLTTGPNIDDGWCTLANPERVDRVSQLQPDGTYTSRISAQGIPAQLYDITGYPDAFAFLDAVCPAVIAGGEAPEPVAEGSARFRGTWSNQEELLDYLVYGPGITVSNRTVAHLTMKDGTKVNANGWASYTFGDDGALNLKNAGLVVRP